MSINVSDYPVYLHDGLKLNREYLESRGSKYTDQKVFCKNDLEISQLSQNREILMDRMKHTVVLSATSFSDMRAGLLSELREEKGQYDYCDVVNICGLSYSKIYSKIEERYENENEQYYNASNKTLLTKEKEIEWLDMQYEQEVKWQKSCAMIAAQGQVFQGHIPNVPEKEIDELENVFYQARDTYLKLYMESKQTDSKIVLHNFIFGNSNMYDVLNKLGNL